ncbi:hemerythrin [Arundinibacter roseus]|uniref:Hemerythrin n=1 Tax=Arundinibacter roseus TaxID=2070510 RepID=A0A4R4K7T9_9BACT|nr:hemerythrin [Arundinibacter roseus]TDB63717.1 hemerythrin [Arundinibacter roseus]
MKKNTYDELITGSLLHQSVTERLDVTATNAPIELDHELIDLILDLYDDDRDFPFQKIRKFSITEILTYLQATHRYYLTKKLPEIEQSLLHIFSRYGKTHELLAELCLFFNAYKNDLIEHIKMEEREFFPYIKKLLKATQGELSAEEISDMLAKASIAQFTDHHDSIEDELMEVSQIIKRYSEFETMPLPYSIFLNQVQIFELELRKHAIIEDHVLVPMAKELEEKLKTA